MLELEQFAQAIFNGMSLASIYALVAIGISLVFGLTSLINFAHGQFLVLGVFIGYSLSGEVPASFIVALLAAAAIVAAMAFLMDSIVLRRTLAQPINGFIVTVGLLIIMESVMVEIWGRTEVKFLGPFSGVTRLGDVAFGHERLLILAATAVVLTSLFLLLHKTELGRRIRAVSDDPEVSMLMGINVGAMISITFVLGSVLAGIAGVFLGTLFTLGPFDGAGFIIKGFAVALIGGLGNAEGALLGAVLIGLGESLTGTYLASEWSDVISFLFIIGILLLRPQGLLRGTQAARQHVLH